MKAQRNFWTTEITKWENKRYQGLLSNLFYSSLQYRQRFLAFILSQIPEGAHVVEIGCGSGKLYDLLPNKNKIKYSGYDISPEAIKIAAEKNRASGNSEWHCIEARQLKNIQADYVITAGLLDWLTDNEINSLLKNNNFTYHMHSFSAQSDSWGKRVHKIFSYFLSKTKKINYSPRVFTEDKINELCSPLGKINLVSHSLLSFGRFVHNLPSTISTDFNSFLAWNYFYSKKNKSNFFENVFKNTEFKIINSHTPNVNDKTVLEVGSGYGFYTEWLTQQKPASLMAIDPAVDTKNFFQSEAYDFINTSLEKLSLNHKYDVIFALGVLEFVTDQEMFCAKLLSLCKKGGLVVLLVPDPKKLSYLIYKKYHSGSRRQLAGNIETNLTSSLKKYTKTHEIRKINGGFLNNLFIIKIDE